MGSHPERNGRGYSPTSGPEGPKWSRLRNPRFLGWLAAAGIAAGAADCIVRQEESVVQRTAAAVGRGCTELFTNPDIARREWRARLAKRAVEIASGCECFSPEQKSEFERRLAACADDSEHMELLQAIQDAADIFYFGAMRKHFPQDEDKVTQGDRTAAFDAADSVVPAMHDLVALRSAAEGFDRIGQYGMTLSLAIRRCEGVLRGEW
ncbi:MAG: hypothetical protein WC840_01400 [Candidatus Peribacteraceae bacterium]